MSWAEFQSIFSERYSNGVVRGAASIAAGNQWGKGPNDQKRKSLETCVAKGDKRLRDNFDYR